ncbi:MAG: hypothetical protein ACREOI_25710 [bacterium]
MLKRLTGIGVIITLFVAVPCVRGQKATEIFIPLGKSPGLSGKYTTIGKIDTVNTQDQTITMTDSSGSYTIKITERTQIWLDNSKLKSTNRRGTFADLPKGLLAEVKYEDSARKDKGVAEWIKIQMTESSAQAPAIRE